MSYAVNITGKAEKDLRSIFSYIAFELNSYINAVGQLERLEAEIESLSELPERYRLYDREPWRSLGLRCMPVDNYCVFYIPYEDDKKVEIIRVLYGGRDIRQVFEEMKDE
jgi:toxin ParE1/3/4